MNFKTVAAVCIALYAIPGGVAYANLVTNGGFETENLDISGNPIPPPPGWTISGDGVGIDTAFPNNGIYDVSFGASTTDPNPGTLSQVIATTPGQSYTVAFALFDEAGLAGNTFTVSFGGLTQTITGDTATVYTLVSFTAPGAGDLRGRDAGCVLQHGRCNRCRRHDARQVPQAPHPEPPVRQP